MTDTRTAILDAAQELAQTRGVNAFSYADLADRLGLRKASIHHHFPSKTDLERELVVRYREVFRRELESIAHRTTSPRRRLTEFIGLFRHTLRMNNRLCLCGMLASEFPTLAPAVQEEVRAFFAEVEHWLADVLAKGRSTGGFSFRGSPHSFAAAYLAMLEGAMITARTFGDVRRFNQAARWLNVSAGKTRRPV